MVYRTHLWWFGGLFILGLTALQGCTNIRGFQNSYSRLTVNCINCIKYITVVRWTHHFWWFFWARQWNPGPWPPCRPAGLTCRFRVEQLGPKTWRPVQYAFLQIVILRTNMWRSESLPHCCMNTIGACDEPETSMWLEIAQRCNMVLNKQLDQRCLWMNLWDVWWCLATFTVKRCMLEIRKSLVAATHKGCLMSGRQWRVDCQLFQRLNRTGETHPKYTQ